MFFLTSFIAVSLMLVLITINLSTSFNDFVNEAEHKKIADLNVGEFTKPMVIPGGFLIVKLNELKEVDRDMNIDKEIKKQIAIKTNQQLNQFSNIYYNKIKKDIKIEKL